MDNLKAAPGRPAPFVGEGVCIICSLFIKYIYFRICPHRSVCDEVNHETAEVMVLNLERFSVKETEEIKNYKVWKVTDNMFAGR